MYVWHEASSSDFASKSRTAFSAQANLKPVNLKTSLSSSAAAATNIIITAELVLAMETFSDRIAQVTGVDRNKIIKYSYIFDNDTFMFTAHDTLV